MPTPGAAVPGRRQFLAGAELAVGVGGQLAACGSAAAHPAATGPRRRHGGT